MAQTDNYKARFKQEGLEINRLRKDNSTGKEIPCVLRLNALLILNSGRLAQLVEQLTLNQRVIGSNPMAPTTLNPSML